MTINEQKIREIIQNYSHDYRDMFLSEVNLENMIINLLYEITDNCEIYEAIGKLKERAERPQKEVVYFPNPVQPLMNNNPNLHYHNGSPCYNNPCVWC